MAIETSVNIAEVSSDLGENWSKIKAFRSLLRRKVDNAVEETAQEFKDVVIANIKGSRIDEDTGELLNSWKVTPKGIARYQVRSTADHAVYLEVGTSAHEITGNNLIFQPEEGTFDEYPESAQRDDGYVELESVDHPGNDAYRYFEAATKDRDWQEVMDSKIDQAVDEAFAESGLK